MSDRATQGPRLVAAGWSASPTLCVEQKRRSPRPREGAGFIGSRVAVHAPLRPGRSGRTSSRRRTATACWPFQIATPNHPTCRAAARRAPDALRRPAPGRPLRAPPGAGMIVQPSVKVQRARHARHTIRVQCEKHVVARYHDAWIGRNVQQVFAAGAHRERYRHASLLIINRMR